MHAFMNVSSQKLAVWHQKGGLQFPRTSISHSPWSLWLFRPFFALSIAERLCLTAVLIELFLECRHGHGLGE